MNNSNFQRIDRLICYWLRHAPEKASLVADEFGWVSLSQLLLSLQENGVCADLALLGQVQSASDKVRWQIDEPNDRIRATHGHSYPVIAGSAIKPPKVLYHGTATKNLRIILEQGLAPMSRRFVHLTEDVQMALAVGKRHGEPVILAVDAEALHNANHFFYNTSDNVWLTDAIPPQFVYKFISNENKIR